jgi:hypothetical protein
MNNVHHTLKAPLLSALPSSCNGVAILLKIYFAFSEGRSLPGGYSIKLLSLSKYDREIPTPFAVFRLIEASRPRQQLVEILNLIIPDKRV